ncbi:MAG: type IX secretion system sortase PorU [Prevotella sp.]|nr:type IX secretion system sortase PorU [Prevotella sp.]
MRKHIYILKVVRSVLLLALFVVLPQKLSAQRFFNLTADEVRIDSVLPQFTYSIPLSSDYADSVYTVRIVYPEFVPMTASDVRKYQSITTDSLPQLPIVEQRIVTERKKGKLEVMFVPLAMRNGKPQILASFMLELQSAPVKRSVRKLNQRKAPETGSRYAEHSVLATGKWAKIRVPSTGVYQLTDALIKQAGFTDLSRVKVYGYGGALQNEQLVAEELIATDDLKEVATYTVGGRRLFHAQGPVTWNGTQLTDVTNQSGRRTTVNIKNVRVRNYFSDYGYYFLTQDEGTPLTVDSASFVGSFYPSDEDYNTLYENDSFAWYHGGRKLFDAETIAAGSSRQYSVAAKGNGTGRVIVVLSSDAAGSAQISLNGTAIGDMTILPPEDYDKGCLSSQYFEVVNNLQSSNTVTIANTGSAAIRLDFIQITSTDKAAAPRLTTGTFPVPEYVHNITNQDLHGDGAADMVIIIPTSQKLRTQAERLKAFHEEWDGLRVRIVPADELYNEFSSGTPDGNAYRRYLKMLYDRAENDDDLPKHLLLFGDCAWDNRMKSASWRGFSPDDFLLTFESENSFNEVYCYLDDGWFCLLDDGEGINPRSSDKLDMAVGRFPVRNEEEAKVMVDKTINYAKNEQAGNWQNVIMFMGDDGNANTHMNDVNDAANDVASRYPGYHLKKVMWDAYTRETNSTGNTYPEASKIIRQQQAAGALIMDYAGHGSAVSISHERVLELIDFQNFQNTNLPLWITASCDIMPFDGATTSIGEEAVLNKKGGAIAFFGTTRTVYASYNKVINMAFLKHVLSLDNGKAITLGEAQRRAKNEMITSGRDRTTNKLQYSLLGDPALSLQLPTMKVVVDAINGETPQPGNQPLLKAGSKVSVTGHIEQDGEKVSNFNGTLYTTVRDSEEEVVCKRNDPEMDKAEPPTPAFVYKDRTKILFNGSDSIRNGEFSFVFAVPMDINYADLTGMMNMYAVSNDRQQKAHGANSNFIIGGSETLGNDSIGPSIYCYLNSPSFTNGDKVNSTPYFVAQISDKDGINASGAGIGHDMELIIDSDMTKTYILNNNFTFDFGSYTTGSTWYNIPELSEGQHRLKFRAWDILNNSSTAELTFRVVKGLEPNIFSVSCTNNPASTTTTFIINHDRTGSNMDVEIEVFDMSGRLLWKHSESGVSTGSAYTVDWDLTVDGGRRLQTGVYIYRARISSDNSPKASKAKKLIILDNK